MAVVEAQGTKYQMLDRKLWRAIIRIGGIMGHTYGFVFAISATAAGLSYATIAHAKADTIVLEPSSPWHLEYAEDKCQLSRRFGEGENSIDFQIEQSGPEPYYALAVFGNLARSNSGKTMTIQFGPNEGVSERSFLPGRLRDSETPFVIMYGIHLGAVSKHSSQGKIDVVDIGPERESAISDVTFGKGLRQPLKLDLGSMGEPLELMHHCTADLMQHIGLDEEGQSKLIRKPEPVNEVEFARFIQQNYPMRMLEKEVGGTVEVRLTINPDGKATTCQIKKSDRPAAFDDVVCFGLLKMAKFKPALGPDGNAVYAFWQTKVTYRVN